jgi:hypothetical protein
MKTFRHTATQDTTVNRLKISNYQGKIPKTKLATGSVSGLYPVILDGGKTIIYTTDKSKEDEIRMKYASKMASGE